MTASGGLSRRALLGAALLLPLAACADAHTTAPSTPLTSEPTPTPTPTVITAVPRLAELEAAHGARIGVAALDTGTGARLLHRADERFPFCSMFKALAAAAVLDGRADDLARVVPFGAADLVGRSPITRERLGAMTLAELCDAAVRFSDGTAGNLLLRELGGPAVLTAFARELGDDVFRMDRVEPLITEALPGDERDTVSPAAFTGDLDRLLLGDAITPDARAALTDLMTRNTTGDARIRAGVAAGWTVADKTGTGSYGTANDAAVLWPADGGAPVVLVVMTTRSNRDDDPVDALLAEATTIALGALR